jgi:hypothetical protein
MKRIVPALLATLAVLLPTAPVQAASCNGASHETVLSGGSASPGSGTPSTPITFSVVYADSAGCPPTAVTLTVAGVGTFALTASGGDFTSGATYSGTLTFGPGTYAYSFGATNGSGGGAKSATLTAVNPAVVTIFEPTPAPPPPQPAPLPPAPPPAPAPAVEPPPAPTEATSPSASEATAASSTGTPRPTGGDVGSATTSGGRKAIHASPSRVSSHERVVARTALDAPFGLPQLDASVRALLAYLTATAAGLALFVALVRRRTHAEPASASIPLAAPLPPEHDEHRVTPLPPMRELIPPVDPTLLSDADERVGPLPGEAGVPRWLRPSLRAARQSHDSRRLRGRED